MFCREFYTLSSFVLCLQFLKLSQIKFSAFILNLYAFNLAIIILCGRQSKAFEKSVSIAPKYVSDLPSCATFQGVLLNNVAHYVLSENYIDI